MRMTVVQRFVMALSHPTRSRSSLAQGRQLRKTVRPCPGVSRSGWRYAASRSTIVRPPPHQSAHLRVLRANNQGPLIWNQPHPLLITPDFGADEPVPFPTTEDQSSASAPSARERGCPLT